MKPVADIPASLEAMEAEVWQIERMIELVKRRANLECELAAMGVGWVPPSLSREKIISLVARRRSLKADDIAARHGPRAYTEARHEAMWLMRRQSDDTGDHRWSLAEIGAAFGGIDHTSVINGLRQHEARMNAAGVSFESVIGRST